MNRRAFIQSATMAGLAPAMAAAQSNAETVRTGMIGTGLRGQHTLGKLMKQPGVKSSALCDLKPDRLDKAASHHGARQAENLQGIPQASGAKGPGCGIHRHAVLSARGDGHRGA